MPHYLAKLNSEQLRAVQSINGYNFVLAGAGSGKTSVLVARIAYMLDKGINPENILLITFTNKAAKEMKDRVIAMLGDKGKLVTACTFHSFCANVLRKYGQFVNIANDFIVLDDSDRTAALDVAKDEYFTFAEKRGKVLDPEKFPSNKDIFRVYEMMASNCYTLDECIANLNNRHYRSTLSDYKADVDEVLKRFAKYKVVHKAMDYDDLLVYTERLFRQNASIREKFDKQYEYIMCDEYQDTNPIQNSIINLISQTCPNLMVVGDDNQSIYAFRYADIQNILGFKQSHPGCKEFMLTENYRSTQEILNLANAVMSHATEGIEKKLHGQRHGMRPEMVKCKDNFAEARWIIADIMNSSVPKHDIAIICRGGAQTFVLESMLNKYGIAFNKYGGTKFMDKAVIKDLLAFLRVLHSLSDEIAMTRVLQMFPGIGPKIAKKLSSGIAENGLNFLVDKQWQSKSFYQTLYGLKMVFEHLLTLNLQEQLDYLVHDYYYQIMKDKIKNSTKKTSSKAEALQKLNDSVTDAETLMEMTSSYKSVSSFLADVVLEATHKDEDITDKLNITTIHSAKGLQYHTVYLLDCIEGITPRCPENSPENPEELRCMYVALTRAKERLVLMVPNYTTKANKYVQSDLSHFLNYADVKRTVDACSVLH